MKCRCCQRKIATIDNYFRPRITSRTRFIENISGVFPHLERRIYTYILSVAASALLLRSIFPFDMSSYYERQAFYRKHFWCFSTFRTKNIHISLIVCCCQSILAPIDIPFRASITNRTRFIENISGVFPHLERRIYTYILCVAARALLLRSIFPFDMSSYYERQAFYRKHFWCFSTFRTKNVHIYLVCCCQLL